MCRNPLKSGQCFLRGDPCYKVRVYEAVAIPSNRVNVSYKNGALKALKEN